MDERGSEPQSFEHEAVIPPRINGTVPRLPVSLLERFGHVYVPDVSDAVGPLYTMDSSLKPLYSPMRQVIGQALTVKLPPGDNLTLHMALGMVESGDVLVVDWRGYMGACATGAMSLVVPIRRGLRGVVVDGGWRDVAELRGLNVPICGRGLVAFSPPKKRIGEINVPVSCGGVIVNPGDIVIGDDEGVVVVPREVAELVADSLPAYKPRATIDDYDIEALEQAAAQRDQYVEQVLAAKRWEHKIAGAGPDSV
jgi:4-hydroxy-4-methyl-2-oxoglutarate aldolase